MDIGLYTACLGEWPLDKVAAWAAEEGFSCLEVDVGRHAPVPDRLPRQVEAVRACGLEVACLTCFGNLLAPDRRERDRRLAAEVVEAAGACGVPRVGVFAGRDPTASEEANWAELAEFLGELCARAERAGVRVVIENWPGPDKDYLATTPAGWRELFARVPSSHLGLNLDPSHLVWQGIDPEEAARPVADRIFLTHAKDTEIFPDRLQDVGYFGRGWWTYRLPGRGRLDWGRWLAHLRALGYSGPVSIEHEDPAYGVGGGPPEERLVGLRLARDHLRAALTR